MKHNQRQLKKQKQNVALLRIAKSDLQPGDTLVIRTGSKISSDARARVSDYLGCKVLIVPPDASLHVLRFSGADHG